MATMPLAACANAFLSRGILGLHGIFFLSTQKIGVGGKRLSFSSRKLEV
jgi:hypothetical protein